MPLNVRVTTRRALPRLTAQLTTRLGGVHHRRHCSTRRVIHSDKQTTKRRPLFNPMLGVGMFSCRLSVPNIRARARALTANPIGSLRLTLFPSRRNSLDVRVLTGGRHCSRPALVRRTRHLGVLVTRFTTSPTLLYNSISVVLPNRCTRLTRVGTARIRVPRAALDTLITRRTTGAPSTPTLTSTHCLFDCQRVHRRIITLTGLLHRHNIGPKSDITITLPHSIFLALTLRTVIRTNTT